jgi:hypothetical protein
MKITPPAVRLSGMDALVEFEVDVPAATNRR